MLAERLPAYDGAVRATLRRAAQELAEDDGEQVPGPPAGRTAPRVMPSGQAAPFGGESFDSRYARAVPATSEAEIARMMSGAL
jgi:hypothetical protein